MRIIINIKHFIYSKHSSKGLIYVHSCKYSQHFYKMGTVIILVSQTRTQKHSEVNLSELTQLRAAPRSAPEFWLQSPHPPLLPSVPCYSYTPLTPDRNLGSEGGQRNADAEDRVLTLDFPPNEPTSRLKCEALHAHCVWFANFHPRGTSRVGPWTALSPRTPAGSWAGCSRLGWVVWEL